MTAAITVVENVYFQTPQDSPYHVESTYQEEVKMGEEQPYSRTYYVDYQKTPLDLGWLKDKQCGLVHIKNKGEEPVLLCYKDTDEGFEIPIGASIRFYPTHPERLELSGRNKTQITITVFPK